MLRREGFSGKITILSADSSAPYDRPNCSKEYLSGHAPAEWMPLWGDDYYRDQEIDLRLNSPVRGIDPRQKKVALDGGAAEPYDALLLATGAEPVRLSFPGSDRPNVFTLRTIGDSQRIIAACEGKRRALVIGASFIGLEAAWSLRERGLEVHVVAPESVPMEKVLGREVGRFVQRVHEDHDVRFHLGKTVNGIDESGATLSDGSAVVADVVVMGVGVRPSVQLAERAGVPVDNGVLVDEYLGADVPGIWAAGDIARWPDRHTGERIRVEHWVVAERQGQAAALNILGDRRPFDAVPFFWSAHYDKTINYVGHAAHWDRIQVDGDIDRGGDFIVSYFRGDKRLAVASVGRDRQNLEAELAMERASA
jgi:NADPH-dependent 2,4-dienoyl-CoA reductase/sulfur reductase-like enzyme